MYYLYIKNRKLSINNTPHQFQPSSWLYDPLWAKCLRLSFWQLKCVCKIGERVSRRQCNYIPPLKKKGGVMQFAFTPPSMLFHSLRERLFLLARELDVLLELPFERRYPCLKDLCPSGQPGKLSFRCLPKLRPHFVQGHIKLGNLGKALGPCLGQAFSELADSG